MIDYKLSRFSVGIDPAGIGTTGLFLKTYKSKYPHKKYVQIKANNPIEAANLIKMEIDKFQEQEHFITLESVVVENLHGGIEKMREVKATRELIGILKYMYGNKIRLHKPIDKSKNLIEKLLLERGRKNEHSIHAQAILEAHLTEIEKKLKCELWNGEIINYGS